MASSDELGGGASGMVIISIWTVLGVLAGVGLTPVAQYFLSAKDARISPLQPGLATGILFGLLAWRVRFWPELFGYSVFAAFCVVASVVDIAEHRLPKRLVLPAYPVVVGLTGIAAVLQGDLHGLARAAVGMLVLPAFYVVLAVVSRGGVGAGDVRLAGPVGWILAWHGWAGLVAGTLLAFVFGSLAGLAMIASRSATRHTQIPFGPAIAAGALTVIVLRGG
jgi:leader peptidase (prepilin peptidase)/N-methyltransferase